MPYRIPPLTLDEIEELLAHDAWTQRNALEDMDMFSRKSEYEEWLDEITGPPAKDRSSWRLVVIALALVVVAVWGLAL